MDWWVAKLAYSVLLIGLSGLLARWEYQETLARGSGRPRLRAWLIVATAVLMAALFIFRPNPEWLLIVSAMLPGYLLARWERRATPAPLPSVRKDRFRMLLLMGFLITAAGMVWLYLMGADDYVGPATGRGGTDSENLMIMVFAFCVGSGIRFGVAVGFAEMVDSGPYPLTRGNRLLFGSVTFLGVVLLLVVGRLVLGGYATRDFTLPGGLAPAGARGWRVEETVRRQIGRNNTLSAIPRGPDVKIDGVCKPRCDKYRDPRSTPGLKIRVAGQPADLTYDGHDKLTYRIVQRRHPLIALYELHHFRKMPRAGRAACRTTTMGWVVVGDRIDGKRVTILVCYGRDERVREGEVFVLDVGLLLRPPLLPLFFGLAFTALGLLLLWWSNRLWRAESDRQRISSCLVRMTSSLVFYETAVALFGAYYYYF